MNPDSQKIEELSKNIADQRAIIDQIYISVEKTRKYFLWSLIITIVFLVLPIILSIIVLPMIFSTAIGALGGI